MTKHTNGRAIYGLSATGESVNGWRFRCRSREMFSDRADAERHIAEFERRCYDPGASALEYAAAGTLRTTVVEYVLF